MKPFQVPLSDDELLEDNNDRFTVDQEPTPNQVTENLQAFGDALASDGDHWQDLPEYFDYFFACFRQSDSIEWQTQAFAWKLLEKCLKQQRSALQPLLNSIVTAGAIDESLEEDNNLHLQNVQMVIYLMCRMACNFEMEQTRRQKIADGSISGVTKGRRGKVKLSEAHHMPNDGFVHFDWEKQRYGFLETLRRLLSFVAVDNDGNERIAALRYLWQPPMLEENFANVMGNSLYKLLENPELIKASGRELLAAIFDNIGLLVRYYGRAKTVSAKLIGLLQQCEYLSLPATSTSPFAEGVGDIVERYGCDVLIIELMTELGRIEPSELTREGSSKPYALFISTLAERCPRLMFAALTPITFFLDSDPPTLRCAVLSAFVDIVLKILSGTLKEETDRMQRDRMLARLKDHLMDVNANVRSKAVQLWSRLAEEKQIPLQFLREGLVEEISERLSDKSVMVRKNAVHFLCAFLINNPFGPNLSPEGMQAKRADLIQERKNLSAENPEFDCVREAEKTFEAIEQLVKDAVKAAVIKSVTVDEENDALDTSEQEMSQHLERLNIEQDVGETVVVRTLAGRIDLDLPLDDSTAVTEYVRTSFFIRAHLLFKDLKPKWTATIINLLSKEESCVSACDLFVQLWFAGKFGGRYDREHAKDNVDNVVEIIVEKLKDLFMREAVGAAAQIETEEVELEDKVVEHKKKMEQLNAKILYYTEAIEFSSQLQTVLPKIGRLLRFGQSSEVTEAIKFIVACRMFHVPGSQASVHELCRLIWRNDAAIKEAVVNACNQLFLSTGTDTADNLAKQTAKNLIGLVRGADVKEQSSVEEVVCEMMKQKPFHNDVLKHLWAYLDQRTDQPEGRCALKLIGMIGRAERSVIKANVAHLLEKGLGEQAEKDFSFAADACYALSMLGNKVDLKHEESIRKDPYRLPKDDPLFERLFQLLSNGFNRWEDDHWTPMMERALNVIFFVSNQPDKFGAKLLISCIEKTIAVLSGSIGDGDKEVDMKTRDKFLVRLFALIGHLALRMLIYVDIAYCGEMKRREQIMAMLRSPSRKKRRTTITAIKRESQQISRSPASEHGSVIDLCEDDMGLAGATAEDIDQENAARILDKEMLSDCELLGKAAPLVLYVLQRERMNKFSPAVLTAASLALSKLMLLSNGFCGEHAKLFFSLLRSSPIPTVRNNLMIAAGDLCFRFPNTVEQYCERLYERIHDQDQAVRQTCLLVLTHLILNDMIKVKGCVADVAQCTLDSRPQMAGLAKLFFQEMAQKGNTIYNLMPDIISRLSDTKTGVEKEQFKEIMKFLLRFIQTEKQNEMLVEKFCQRFQSSKSSETEAGPWQYLSFCLTQLTLNEKAFRKLVDNVQCFGDKLSDPEVYENFCIALASCKKSCKTPELKHEIEDFEETLKTIHEQGFEAEEAAERAKEFKNRARSTRKTPARSRLKTPKQSPRKKIKAEIDSPSFASPSP